MTESLKVGVVGCGQISGIYIETVQKMKGVELLACADIVAVASRFRADMYHIPRVYTPEQLYADPEIDIVLNTTIPEAHTEVSLAALYADKHLYTEKPLATTREDAHRIVDLAARRGLRVGCAPDTFLGAGIQTCRKLIADGVIGRPVAAAAFFMHHGPETRSVPVEDPPTRQRVTRKEPGHYYVPGWGPLFDMGPYYLTALCVLVGPIRRVTGSAQRFWPERPLGAPLFTAYVPSHIAAVLDHENGAVSTIMTTTDVWPTGFPHIEIYGEEGTLRVPDPNMFAGPVRFLPANEKAWRDVPIVHAYEADSRGIGIAEMARSIRLGRPHRAHGDMAYHVVDVVQGIHEASRESRHVQITSRFPMPRPLPAGLVDGDME